MFPFWGRNGGDTQAQSHLSSPCEGLPSLLLAGGAWYKVLRQIGCQWWPVRRLGIEMLRMKKKKGNVYTCLPSCLLLLSHSCEELWSTMEESKCFWLPAWAPQDPQHKALILASLVCASIMAPKFLTKGYNMEVNACKICRDQLRCVSCRMVGDQWI